jgi:hypothetical protein
MTHPHLACGPGGDIASTFDNPGSVKLGHCALIEEMMIGEDRLIHFSGVAMGEACTIVLRGASARALPLSRPGHACRVGVHMGIHMERVVKVQE